MENTLQFDLNEIVSKEINSKISTLESTIESLQSEIRKKDLVVYQLREQVKNSELSLSFITNLREEFSKIIATPKTKDCYGNSKTRNQFNFIENVLLNLFNIKK